MGAISVIPVLSVVSMEFFLKPVVWGSRFLLGALDYHCLRDLKIPPEAIVPTCFVTRDKGWNEMNGHHTRGRTGSSKKSRGVIPEVIWCYPRYDMLTCKRPCGISQRVIRCHPRGHMGSPNRSSIQRHPSSFGFIWRSFGFILGWFGIILGVNWGHLVFKHL